MKRLSSRTILLLAAFMAALVLTSCGHKREGAKEDSKSLPIAQVRLQAAGNKSRAMTEEVVGTVRAKFHATLEAKLSGRIDKMPVVLGQRVKAGELVARLDAAEINARLEQAEAALEQSEREWNRVSALFEQQAATRSEYDAAQSRNRVAKGAAAEARAMMGYVKVVAPFDGVVTKKWVDVGDLAAPGKPLLSIEDPATLQLEADVPQAIASHVQRDARLDAHVEGVSGDLTGTVSEIAPAADSVSRTVRIKVDLSAQPGLSSGQFARLLVPVGESHTLRVPVSAVVERGQLEIVFVVANQRAQLHLVKTGKRIGGEIEVLSGLRSGDAVVIEGAALLTDGQPVEAK
jgi:RND family efflux transporter MFP subunit